jgi:phage terminase large subunit GpA-like protein
MKVSEAAEKYLHVRAANGNYVPWDSELTPYLVEPMNCLNDRRYSGLVLVGPARSGKTILLLAWMAYVLKCDPGDMQIIHTTKDLAKDLSKREIDRSLLNSPELKDLIARGSHDDNIFDKIFKAGNMLNLGWPSIAQLSSRTVKYMAGTDYDRRAVDDVDSEGALFGLMRKRTESFMSAGMSAIETSPGFPLKDPTHKPKTLHEAAPCEGALSYYNQGDRRRFYWPCDNCGEYFMAEMEHLKWEQRDTLEETAATAAVHCPSCNHRITQEHRRRLNKIGHWLKDGQEITPDGKIHGEGRVSDLATFWFQGPVACFQTWTSLALEQLRAEAEYERTGLEEDLKRTITQDQGRPYLPKSREGARSYLDLMETAEDYGYKVVPIGARFLLASVDVQKGCFIVQVEAFGLGLEHWYIDRFKILKSERYDDEGHPFLIDAGAYRQDWDLLVEQVMEKTYPLADDSERHMRIKMVACDSGGAAGVTEQAYQFYKRLRRQGKQHSFILVKGSPSGPRVRKTLPESQRKDRRANARGEIPVHLVNTNLAKDQIEHALGRTDPGPGCTHFPEWFEEWWYKELLAEVKDGDRWVKVAKRNESLDLSVYNRALLVVTKAEDIDWRKPPGWAKPWDENTLVIEYGPEDPNDPESRKPSQEEPEQKSNSELLASLGRGLGS